MIKIGLFVSVHFFAHEFFHFVPFSVRKIAVYPTYFHRTRANTVLKFRILLITESSVLRKGSFPIIGQHFYHFFSFEKLFSHEILIRLYSKSHDFFSFFMNSLLCISTALLHLLRSFFYILYISKLFFTCKDH